MKRVKCYFIAFVLLLSLFPVYTASATEQGPQIKVKLKNYLGNQSSITLKSNGEYQLADGRTFMKNGEEIQVKIKSGQLVVYKGSNEIGTYDTFSIVPVDSKSLLYLNNRAYYGSFQFTIENGTYIRPINSVYIEDYLKGVVPSEMPASWHMEALKAQTIAARTYALSNQSRVIDDTISFQVYRGAEGDINSDKAIAETNGIVLKYNNNLVYAFFSASNGGVTELNSNAWPTSTKLPYFAIQEDPYDSKMTWSIAIDKQQMDLSGKDLSKPGAWWTSMNEKDSSIVPNIKTWLKSNGYPNKDIKITDIPILSLDEKTSGGRVTKGSIQVNFYVKDLVDEQGALIPQMVQYTNVAASKIRAMVGLNMMRSYLVDESIATADTISIKGRGNGHGVGLSQYGAKNRAENGQKYETILQFYYPGATLVKEYNEVREDTVAPIPPVPVPVVNISNVTVKANYGVETANIGYRISENAKITVAVKNSQGKLIATLVKQKLIKKGSRATSWNFSKNSDGTYKVSITAIDGNQRTKTVTKTLQIKRKKGKVTATSLNIRAKKSTSSKMIGKLKKNQTITILIKDGSWYKIKTNTITGYVAAKYIKIK